MRELSSFRDPSGSVYYRDGAVLRQVNQCYEKQYRQLMDSGLYADLVKDGLLISHDEQPGAEMGEGGYLVIKPQMIPFISYPYEWSFG